MPDPPTEVSPGTGRSDVSSSAPAGSDPATEDSTEEADDPGATENGAAPAAAEVGEKFTYDDGLAVEITKTSNVRASQYASGADSGDAVTVFTVRITNGTEATIDADLVGVEADYGQEGDPAETVYDSDGPADAEGMSGKSSRPEQSPGRTPSRSRRRGGRTSRSR